MQDVEAGTFETYLLVSAKEEDILENKISTESPVGQAIIRKKKNQVVEVNTPGGLLKYKILKISRPQ